MAEQFPPLSAATLAAANQVGAWLAQDDLALLLGELPRLQDTPEGYGPRGKDFISHVTFPPEILDAWRQLREDAQLAGALQARTLG
ncbi:protein ydcF [Klebsiella pneumoniae]|nr:protein ydcF [Klebsiella pneumoniae]SXL36514.1 protein ydcF [Klebsiella pneumoniae]